MTLRVNSPCARRSERQLLQGSGLDFIYQQGEFSISAGQLDTVCMNALTLTNDPQFGLRLGARINLSSQGIFGYALMTSATVGDALKLLIRCSRAILPSIHIEVQQHDSRVDVVVAATHLPLELERFYRAQGQSPFSVNVLIVWWLAAPR